jgi:hypothetical protein
MAEDSFLSNKGLLDQWARKRASRTRGATRKPLACRLLRLDRHNGRALGSELKVGRIDCILSFLGIERSDFLQEVKGCNRVRTLQFLDAFPQDSSQSMPLIKNTPSKRPSSSSLRKAGFTHNAF